MIYLDEKIDILICEKIGIGSIIHLGKPTEETRIRILMKIEKEHYEMIVIKNENRMTPLAIIHVFLEEDNFCLGCLKCKKVIEKCEEIFEKIKNDKKIRLKLLLD